MLKQMLIALRMAMVTLIVTGLLYPLAVTALARVMFPRQAAGSLLTDEGGRTVGSQLIGQNFSQAFYFQPRPSAAGTGYDALASGGSNLGPTSKKLRERMIADLARLRAQNPQALTAPPVELITASGSGLDPHLSPAAALWQVPRIAAARHLDLQRIRQMVESKIKARTLSVLGEPCVNVLELNLALDHQFGQAY